MARNIFNQPAKDTTQTAAQPPAPAKSSKLPGSVGGLRDSLREITANSIRDIDVDQIDMDGLRDRLVLEDSSIDELADSIRKHGQQVPIMVRPSDQPERYRVVYGRRRLAAIRKVGGTVKAIVRTLDDDASLIAQGQENNLRLDPSFIEKSIFIKEMQEAGYKPGSHPGCFGPYTTRRVKSSRRARATARRTYPPHWAGPWRRSAPMGRFSSSGPENELGGHREGNAFLGEKRSAKP